MIDPRLVGHELVVRLAKELQALDVELEGREMDVMDYVDEAKSSIRRGLVGRSFAILDDLDRAQRIRDDAKDRRDAFASTHRIARWWLKRGASA